MCLIRTALLSPQPLLSLPLMKLKDDQPFRKSSDHAGMPQNT
ncbi:hypothetical protein E2C01_031287 [Portunus trituberculatus]|uniref:Uncharacterized protein n=1 Tax=Portunus trituberculatus TaxID=210409 RepID=A0A5B7EX76_PORTR|nr:hypothetical protein [Portunus trituberculatus]